MPESTLVGLMADTHDNKDAILRAVTVFNGRHVGLVLHAGDYIAPFNARWMSELSAPMHGVFGNNDGERFGLKALFQPVGEIHRPSFALDWGGKRLLLMHEPDELDALAASKCYDAIVYGHTHEVDIRPGEPLVVNPGEACGWTTGRATVGILDLATMSVDVVDVGG